MRRFEYFSQEFRKGKGELGNIIACKCLESCRDQIDKEDYIIIFSFGVFFLIHIIFYFE